MGFSKIKSFLFEEIKEESQDNDITYGDMTYEDIANLSLDSMAYGQEQGERKATKINKDNDGAITIDSIYQANDLSDTSKSIYKIKEIQSVLPNTLPISAKKESVLGMMQVSNITLEEVLRDADNRRDILTDVLKSTMEESTALIEESNKEILELEQRINELKESIISNKLEIEQQEKIITNEINTINSIVDFIL